MHYKNVTHIFVVNYQIKCLEIFEVNVCLVLYQLLVSTGPTVLISNT